MPQGTKIATCCYCGTRAALVLRGDKRHELSCASCGAPLHDLKLMPAARLDGKNLTRKPVKSRGSKGATPNPYWETRPEKSKKKKKKKKSRKSGVSWFLDEAFDAIEDIFD
ncbi:hypothetical protein Q4577_13940 [Marinovum sp. 2_MG-2023]|uniref:hypothetical protein n=1 Tax=Roseobacteraceae TaxID=2854170 RepID=UPI001FD3235D|nr:MULTISPECIES: hypothetical protein [Roseobacteraceae]MCJ7873843.1 hypothetical protein [Phaeobacter sp. J2-8]MDO6731130.1 hypothetical protein [Marinovum sp. 2_MG-2023]MDO6778627.1 hypothetical protein [Marinovum sp. 1_MG-2023]